MINNFRLLSTCQVALLLLLPLMFVACSGKGSVALDEELARSDAQVPPVKADSAAFDQMKQLWLAENFGELEKYARGVLANTDPGADLGSGLGTGLTAEQRGLASYYLAYACLEQGQRREALLRARLAVKLLPEKELPPALLLALTELAFGGKDKAERRLFQLQQAHPKSLAVFLTLARANELEGYFARAAYWYGQGIELKKQEQASAPAVGPTGATIPALATTAVATPVTAPISILNPTPETALAQAQAESRAAICPRPELSLADLYVKKALALWQAGDATHAIEDLDAALALKPQDAAALNDRGVINLALGRFKEALADFNQAIAANPGYPASFLNRSNYYVAAGRYDLALRDCRLGLAQSPDYAPLLVAAGQIYAAQKKYAEALGSFEKACQAAPKNAQVLNELAWFLATCPRAALIDPQRAIILAKESVYLSATPEPGNYDTLAAAFARAGNFEEAVRAGETAVNLAKRAGLGKEITHSFEERLALYKQAKSYLQ